MIRVILLLCCMFTATSAHAQETKLTTANSVDTDTPWLQPVETKPQLSKEIIVSIAFSSDSAIVITQKMEAQLTPVLGYLANDKNSRIQISAYASPNADKHNLARQTSLKRSIAVRKILMNHNIARERIVAKALVSTTLDNQDRIDIYKL